MQIQMPFISYDIDYTIVICTYNPDERLLKRCLNAVYNLDTDGITIEVILVDNNSLIPVESLSYVREHFRKIPSMRTIMVALQGFNYARIAAISEAKGKYLIFFDDDNEPGSNYLQELKKLNTIYPQVAAVGPGDVTLNFTDGIEENIESYARGALGERHEEAIKFSGLREWQPCYPFGTGRCTFTFLLKEYINLAKRGKFILPDRKDKQFTSGEDMQMVMFCISKDYFAGVSPTLQTRRIIPRTRANIKYLQRLAYCTGLCYETGLVQVFPEHKDKLEQEIISKFKFSTRVLRKYFKTRFSPDPLEIFELIEFIVSNAGVYLALNRTVPVLVKRIVMNLELAEFKEEAG
jgi:glycosyltransferase involved in cell wall biosynthesis